MRAIEKMTNEFILRSISLIHRYCVNSADSKDEWPRVNNSEQS